MKQKPKQDIEIFIDGIANPAEPNQALKDAAERHSNETLRDNSHVSFIAGAKWQQERSYSEEDMREAYKYGKIYDMTSFEEWFEQFKKK